MDTAELKTSVATEIENRRTELGEISRELHDNPELAFEEHRSSARLVNYLEKNGFTVETGICELPTAFKGSYGQGSPAIAFLAEYDALPGVGHGCGHNLIATASVAAGVALKRAVDEYGGSVVVFGTPGEEFYGGKVVMAEKGAFTDIDAAMICHPGSGNRIIMNTLALETLTVEFRGKAAHAAAEPQAGINALEAMILSFNAINSLRQHIREECRIHGIITNGGEAANIVPDYTAATFMVRAEDDTYLEELKKKVIACFEGAARATGATLEYKWGQHYAAMVNNLAMARLFRQNMKLLGRTMQLGDNTMMAFSTDVGNVSRLVPTIQPLISIAQRGISIHTLEFAAIAATEDGLDGMLRAAKAMAMTAVDLLADAKAMGKVQKEFRRGG